MNFFSIAALLSSSSSFFSVIFFPLLNKMRRVIVSFKRSLIFAKLHDSPLVNEYTVYFDFSLSSKYEAYV